MRSFFACWASLMKATNSLEGFGILIVSVGFILILIVNGMTLQRYDYYHTFANHWYMDSDII